MYTFLRSLAVASASVGIAAILPGSLCATTPVPPTPASLVVQNDRSAPVTVYVEQGNFDLRVGAVAADTIATLRLPKGVIWGQRDVRILAHPYSGFDVETRRLDVRPGARIGVLVPPAGERIAVRVGTGEPVMRDPHPGSPATSVTVRNDGDRKVAMFVEQGAFDTRLGSVSPHATATLRIPTWLVNRRDVVLLADRENGLDFRTPPMRILKGHHLGMIVPAL